MHDLLAGLTDNCQSVQNASADQKAAGKGESQCQCATHAESPGDQLSHFVQRIRILTYKEVATVGQLYAPGNHGMLMGSAIGIRSGYHQ